MSFSSYFKLIDLRFLAFSADTITIDRMILVELYKTSIKVFSFEFSRMNYTVTVLIVEKSVFTSEMRRKFGLLCPWFWKGLFQFGFNRKFWWANSVNSISRSHRRVWRQSKLKITQMDETHKSLINRKYYIFIRTEPNLGNLPNCNESKNIYFCTRSFSKLIKLQVKNDYFHSNNYFVLFVFLFLFKVNHWNLQPLTLPEKYIQYWIYFKQYLTLIKFPLGTYLRRRYNWFSSANSPSSISLASSLISSTSHSRHRKSLSHLTDDLNKKNVSTVSIYWKQNKQPNIRGWHEIKR